MPIELEVKFGRKGSPDSYTCTAQLYEASGDEQTRERVVVIRETANQGATTRDHIAEIATKAVAEMSLQRHLLRFVAYYPPGTPAGPGGTRWYHVQLEWESAGFRWLFGKRGRYTGFAVLTPAIQADIESMVEGPLSV